LKRFGITLTALLCSLTTTFAHADQLSDAIVKINQSTVPAEAKELRKIRKTESALKTLAWVAFLGGGAATVLRLPPKFAGVMIPDRTISAIGGTFLLVDEIVYAVFPSPAKRLSKLQPNDDFFKHTIAEQDAAARENPAVASFLIDLAQQLDEASARRPNSDQRPRSL